MSRLAGATLAIAVLIAACSPGPSGSHAGSTGMVDAELECPAALLAQDGHVTEVVGSDTPSLDGERLRLLGRWGLGLLYEPAPEG